MSGAPSWDAYRTLSAVLAEGSLSAAARRLGITQPTVGRHIDALEAALGETLFVRTSRGLSPTERAEALMPLLHELESTAAAIERTARAENQTAGRVRITASEVFATLHLPPILTELRIAHPRLEIELVASDAVTDLSRREADIAVRMTRPSQDGLLAKKLGEVRIGLFGHERYLARKGSPRAPEELSSHDLIGFDRLTPAIRAMLGHLPDLELPRFAVRTDAAAVQQALLEAGFGLGFCQTLVARRRPELVRVLEGVLELPLEVWLVTHENLRAHGPVATAFEALADGLGRLLAE